MPYYGFKNRSPRRRNMYGKSAKLARWKKAFNSSKRKGFSVKQSARYATRMCGGYFPGRIPR